MFESVSLSRDMTIEILSIGREHQPVVVLDQVLANPESLLSFAAGGDAFSATSNDYYPGVRKELPKQYSDLLCQLVLEKFPEIFEVPSDSQARVNLCALSMATTPAEKLRPIQSLPHFDTSHNSQLAVVHYLCSESHGGTSFFRHRNTGFEAITEGRIQRYAPALKAEVMGARFLGQQYVNGDNEWFERIGGVSAKFNRAIFYRGNMLHSGDIRPEMGLSPEPETGRLTANAFIQLESF